jgi:hypothetical protein
VTRDHLRDLDALFVEANYDETMLQNDIRRPWATKQRISSRHGHLSNDQAAELVSAVATDRLQCVVLGHLSSDCNCPKLAAAVISDGLRSRGFNSVEVECARQREALPMREVVAAVQPTAEIGELEPESQQASAEAGRAQAEWTF